MKTSIHYLHVNVSAINGSGVLEEGSNATEGKIELCLVTTAFEEHNSIDLAMISTEDIVKLPYTSVGANFTLEGITIGELDSVTEEIDEVVDQLIRNVTAVRCTADSTEEFTSASEDDNREGQTIYLCLSPVDPNARLFNINLKAVFGEGVDKELTLISNSTAEFLVDLNETLSDGTVRAAIPIISAFFSDDNTNLELTGDVDLSKFLARATKRVDDKVNYRVFIDLSAPVIGCFAALMQKVSSIMK